MAYVQEHKLGLNMWQLRFFLNHLWGVGETFAEHLASNRGNIQGWALVLLYVGPSDHPHCVYIFSSPSNLQKWLQVLRVALGCTANALSDICGRA